MPAPHWRCTGWPGVHSHHKPPERKPSRVSPMSSFRCDAVWSFSVARPTRGVRVNLLGTYLWFILFLSKKLSWRRILKCRASRKSRTCSQTISARFCAKLRRPHREDPRARRHERPPGRRPDLTRSGSRHSPAPTRSLSATTSTASPAVISSVSFLALIQLTRSRAGKSRCCTRAGR